MIDDALSHDNTSVVAAGEHKFTAKHGNDASVTLSDVLGLRAIMAASAAQLCGRHHRHRVL